MKLIGKQNRERGFTLLEYCAGAAVLAGVVYTAMQALGGNISGLMGSIGGWADRRAAEINQAK